jgi:hypothetical protein
MVTRVLNFIFAAFGSFAYASALMKDQASRDFMTVLVAIVNLFWLAAALGLFFRSRTAWCGSLLGLGAMLSGSITLLVMGLKLAPTKQDPTEGAGYAILFGFSGMLLSMFVLVGLFRLRAECFCPKDHKPNQQGAADRRQPSGPEINGTSAAAASRRAP